MKKILTIVIIVLLSSVLLSQEFDRKTTFVAGGALWDVPSNWNPFVPWDAVSGTVGLVYETLFEYDTLNNSMKPFLAEDGKWISDNEYLLKLRKGIKWTDGVDFTSKDVYFTFDVGRKNEEAPISYVWKWLKEIKVIDNYTLKFIFSEPRYSEWNTMLYDQGIIPEHIWSKKTAEEVINTDNKNPIGTGSYKYEVATNDKMVWIRNDNWWGKDVFGKLPAPKRIVIPLIYSNNVALGMLMKGELDLSNFFLPGIPKVKSFYNLTTWYEGKPYMLPGDSATLYLNTHKKYLNNTDFRKAIAYAINRDMIIKNVFEYQSQKANPSGLLPIDSWMKYYNKEVNKKYGFDFNKEKAKSLLKKLGFKDINHDGFLEDKDGKKVSFEIIVPSGWTDWMEAIKIISKNLQDIGIKADAKFPDEGVYWDDLTKGDFDMAINNYGNEASSTPWTYWNSVMNYRINQDVVEDGNFGRYNNPKLFKMIKDFNTKKLGSTESYEIASLIEEEMLKNMPVIPLWFNGLWYQASSDYWTNWPTEKNPVGYPCSWSGYWSRGGIDMLLNLKPSNHEE
ncbi:ABC transporter substrate-binding protein [Tepiditoga spiralis]|uniref:ABC transporter substrate-binding protein n=1 Tax=Tepiditoga spiralis TaxID=2108365 RepID=A0A7G1G5H6_9BACT|nr:ABC transporter substrate-binding protein [Tepiditoga spiralis]BBE31661.1 ABC transporter substrate-binding protein [Tepiditoga spiralis]